VQPTDLVIRNVADGKAAAFHIDRYLSEAGPATPSRESESNVPTGAKGCISRAGRLNSEELLQMTLGASDASRVVPLAGLSAGLSLDEARAEAERCLHCDCGNLTGCSLRRYAAMYGAVATRYRGERKALQRHIQHGDIIYEPGKCILCGRCVQIATAEGEPLGLTFIGRGFDVRVDVPFDGTIAEGLANVGQLCADACPTGALAHRDSFGCNPERCGSCGTV
jgi:ferredoxin